MEVVRNEAEQRFEVHLPDGTLAFADYRLDPGKVIFPHTVVPPNHEGQGIGSAIAKASLDWAPRHRHMRMHTSLHLLCSLIPGAGVTGGQIGAERSRLDFDLPDPPAKDWLTERLNALVASDHPVGERWITEAELDAPTR